nr:MAG TPA: Cbb3-type cytochrome c oxidase subunit [Caudoviricetes sp.]
MEYILFFMFLPTILWAVTGKGKEKINKFAISTLEEIVESLPEESSKSKKP